MITQVAFSKHMIAAISIICIVFSYNTYAQTAIADSLKLKIFAAGDAEEKLQAIIAFCDEYQSINRDTIYTYAMEAMQLAQNQKNAMYKKHAQLAFANAYFVWGWVDSSLHFTELALHDIDTNDIRMQNLFFKLLRQKALCFGAVSRFPEALKNLYLLLNNAKQANHDFFIASTMNTIGSVQLTMGDASAALQWIHQAKQFLHTGRDATLNKANIFTNLAYAQYILGNYDSANYYISVALPECRSAQNLNSLATALRIQSAILTATHDFGSAESALVEMQDIRRKLNGETNFVEDHLQLANFYAKTGNLQKAIQFCLEKLQSVAQQSGNDTSAVGISDMMRMKLQYYEALADFYKQSGETEAYLQTLENIIVAKDSFYVANNSMALAEIQTRYEVQQKENTILEQQVNLAKKNLQIYGITAGLILSGIIFFIAFREYRRRQSLKMQQAMEEEKIAAALAVKDAEEKERKRIAADLHDNIGTHANAILYNTGLLQKSNNTDQDLVENLYDSATQMLNNLRETLWAMKTTDLSAAELWIRLIGYIKKMGKYYTHIQFAAEGNAPELMLKSIKALHIIMVIQEAIQNAIKHGQANIIRIHSIHTLQYWTLKVTDDGKGFDTTDAAIQKESYGLHNMQERAKANNMSLQVITESGKGTSIQLTILF